MDIYGRLKQDHDKHRELADKLSKTSGDSEERRALWDEFKPEVEAHAAAEEQTFYGVLIQKAEGHEEARHGISEHKDAANLIEELSELDMGSGGWIHKFEKLKHELEHHMDEEENDIFEQAQELIDRDRAVELVDEFDSRKREELAG